MSNSKQELDKKLDSIIKLLTSPATEACDRKADMAASFRIALFLVENGPASKSDLYRVMPAMRKTTLDRILVDLRTSNMVHIAKEKNGNRGRPREVVSLF